MDGFEAELMRRSPLAAGVMELCDFVFQDQPLESIWQAHRGPLLRGCASFWT